MLLAALAGVLGGAGALLILEGLRHEGDRHQGRSWRLASLDGRRMWRAAGLGLAGLAVTRWPVAAVALCGAGWFWDELFGSRRTRQDAIARTEAIAAWTEMLRDTMAGAHGLEEALVTTAVVSPGPIRSEVTELATRIEHHPLHEALCVFAEDLDHPTGDLVVTALKIADRGAVGDLNELLGTLAVAARDEAAMRLRVEAARARLRMAVRVIGAVTGATILGLVVLNRSYLEAYSAPAGQAVIGAVTAMWSAGLWWLARLSRFTGPERFFGPTMEQAPR